MTAPGRVIRTPEGVFVLRDDTHLSRWIEQHGRLDIAAGEIRLFQQHIPYGGTVINAGASLGDHAATYARLVGPEGTVLAFEPHPVTYEALARNMAIFTNVICFNGALGEREGDQEFALEQNIGASHIFRGATPGVEEVTRKVQVGTLDQIIPSLSKKVDFIHLDAEGMEPEILLGGRELIGRFRPVMLLEVCPGHLARYGRTEADLMSILSDAKYRVETLEGQTGKEQRDILCLPV